METVKKKTLGRPMNRLDVIKKDLKALEEQDG